MSNIKKFISFIITAMLAIFMVFSLIACAPVAVEEEKEISKVITNEYGETIIVYTDGTQEVLDVNPVECYSNNWKVVLAPTMDSEGVATAICSDCGQSKAIILPELDSVNNSVPVYMKETSVVSCEQGGIDNYTYNIPVEYLPDDIEWQEIVDVASSKGIIITEEDRQTTLKIDVIVAKGPHMFAGTPIDEIYKYSADQGVVNSKGIYYLNPDLLRDSNGLPIIVEFLDHVATPSKFGKGYYVCSKCGAIVLVNTYKSSAEV